MLTVDILGRPPVHSFSTGWLCQGTINTSDSRQIPFTVVFPPSCYGRSRKALGRQCNVTDVREICEEAVRQHIMMHGLLHSTLDLPALHELEIDGLVSAIDRAKLRRANNPQFVSAK